MNFDYMKERKSRKCLIEAIKVFIFIKYLCCVWRFCIIFVNIYLLDRRHLLEGLSWRQHRCFVHPRFRIQDRYHHWSDLLPQLVPIPCSATTQYQHINSIWRVWSIRHLSSSLSYPLVNKEISQKLWREIE